jgi:hypothetical protein
VKTGQYRCGDCRLIHFGKPDPTWHVCPACAQRFLDWYARFVAEYEAKHAKPTQARMELQ